MVETGVAVFDFDARVARWAKAALIAARQITSDPAIRAANLRHGDTWFVGVDALPNDTAGAIKGVPLQGPWEEVIAPPEGWHRAQLSIVYPGYPARDPSESIARHKYRLTRFAAHVDGLLPIGPENRRYLREPHGFILGLPLTASGAAPLMVWPGSHALIGAALRAVVGTADPDTVDLTEAYHAARAEVFERIEPLAITIQPGQSVLLHRHLLHGIAPWQEGVPGPDEGRMVAYFRPQISAAHWLAADVVAPLALG